MFRSSFRAILGAAALVLPLVASHGVAAQDYFKGKQISLYAGRPPGGGVDSEMRLVAQFLGAKIPGNPTIIARNMPGAGGITLGNFIYTAAPDGFSLGIPGRTAFVLGPVTGDPNARYDLRKLTWIGSSNSSNFILWIRKGSGVTNLAELKASKKEIIIGGSGAGNADTVVPAIFAKFEGMPLKVVRGYPGVPEEVLAMERGEIDGIVTARESFANDPVKSGLASIVLQTFPVEKDVPLMEEVAQNPRAKALLNLFSVPLRVGLAVIAPPGMPAGPTEILRKAYLETVSSPEYIAEATNRGFELGTPNLGNDLASFIEKNLASVSPQVLEDFREFSK